MALVGLILLLGCGAAVLWRTAKRLRETEKQVADLRLVRREVEELRGELGRGLAVTRAHLAAVAAGQPPERDVIVHGSPYRNVPAAEALALYERTPDLFVLDVRSQAEYGNGHIPNAHLIPVDELEDRLTELPPPDTLILVHCAAGGRSSAACETLGRRGYTQLLNLAGGMHAWTGPREKAKPEAPPPNVFAGTNVSYHGGPVSEAQVIGAIRECFDPEIPLNIYDLGLIYGVDIAESVITVTMTLTSEACPSARAIPEDVRSKIAALGQPNVTVDIVWNPPWHPSRISDQGKEKLGLS